MLSAWLFLPSLDQIQPPTRRAGVKPTGTSCPKKDTTASPVSGSLDEIPEHALPACSGDSGEILYLVSHDLYLRCQASQWRMRAADNRHRPLQDSKKTPTCEAG